MDFLQILTLALNLLIIPLLKILWDLKVEITKMNGRLEAHGWRLEQLEKL